MKESIISELVEIVRLTGKQMCNEIVLKTAISTAGRDIKARADIFSEQELMKKIKSISSYPILSEESPNIFKHKTKNTFWVIDPLDGTMNYNRGFPIYSISLALIQDKNPVFGIIYDIFNDLMYIAANGKATINNQPLSVSANSMHNSSILATGFPLMRSYEQNDLEKFIKQISIFKKIRMIGSAAMSLAYVAQGTFDAYFEEDIMIWDVAAGLALVKAAGGEVLMLPGSNEHSVICVATNGRLNIEAFVNG